MNVNDLDDLELILKRCMPRHTVSIHKIVDVVLYHSPIITGFKDAVEEHILIEILRCTSKY